MFAEMLLDTVFSWSCWIGYSSSVPLSAALVYLFILHRHPKLSLFPYTIHQRNLAVRAPRYRCSSDPFVDGRYVFELIFSNFLIQGKWARRWRWWGRRVVRIGLWDSSSAQNVTVGGWGDSKIGTYNPKKEFEVRPNCGDAICPAKIRCSDTEGCSSSNAKPRSPRSGQWLILIGGETLPTRDLSSSNSIRISLTSEAFEPSIQWREE